MFLLYNVFMHLILELSEDEVSHMLEALNGVAAIVERESYELAAAIIIRNVIAEILRAMKESR